MILSGGKEAKHMTTGPWDVIQQEYIPRAIRGRPPAKMVSEKVQNNTKTIVRGETSDFENFNFGQLHRTHIYPNKQRNQMHSVQHTMPTDRSQTWRLQ